VGRQEFMIVISMIGRLCEFHHENGYTGSISPIRLRVYLSRGGAVVSADGRADWASG